MIYNKKVDSYNKNQLGINLEKYFKLFQII